MTLLKDGQLRGCIGTFGDGKLGKTLQEYSYYAAMKDTRFPPVSLTEVPALKCEISLLSSFEVI